MRTALLILTLPLALLLACSDQSLGRFNASPEAAITSHADGTEVLEGYDLTLRGTVSDADDDAGSLVASWYLEDTPVCADQLPESDGLTTCTLRPSLGQGRVTLEVHDPDNAAGSAELQLQVTPTEAPTVQILAPADGDRLYSDELLSFEALVGDAEDPPSALSLAWESDLDGPLDLDGAPDDSGNVSSTGSLSPGSHALRLTVTDLSGKTGVDQVIVEVGPPNGDPSCAITSPEDGGAARSGTALTLAGTASDPDQGADSLLWTWSSSLDGEIGSGNPTSDGSIAMSWPGLSAGTHSLRLLVEDERGARCTDEVLWTVGEPPTVEILAPAPGEVVNLGDSLLFQAQVEDERDPPETLVLQWRSDRDGLLSSASADSSGSALWSTDSLSAGLHLVTLTATDREGLSATDTVSLRVNQGPSAPVVHIQPEDPRTDDELGVIIDTEAVDPEGEALRYLYRWFKDGVEATAFTSTTVPASATSRDETWTVEVRAEDASATGPAGSDAVEIGNSPPVLSSVGLSPSTAQTNTTLTATPSSADADGDSVSYRTTWTVDGVPVPVTGDSLSGSTWFDKGQQVQAIVTPDDGSDSGESLASATITVQNSPPTAPEIAIDPTDPVEGLDDLRCEVLAASTDADGDEVELGLQWTVDGVDFPGALDATLAGDTVDGAETVADEEWTCTATPDDGEVEGTSASDTVTILSADVDYSGVWDLDAPISLRCAYGLVDIDFDAVDIDDLYPSVRVSSVGSSQPGTMSGTFPTETTIAAMRTISGSCTETYQFSGSFLDANSFEGTFQVSFSGGAWCFDCRTTAWELTATR